MKEILNKTCRLCLAIEAQEKALVFVQITEDQKTKFEELTGIELILNDHYPLNMCTDCSDLLENFFFYKHQLVRKQKDLMDFLNKLTQQPQEKVDNYDEIEFLDEILEEQFNKSDDVMLTVFDEYDPPSVQSNDLNDDDMNFVYREELQYENNEPKLILHPTFLTDGDLSENLTGTFLIDIDESADSQVEHIRQFICNFCGNVYHNRRDMRSHLRSHNQQKRFQCLSCDKAFRYQHHLVNHSRIHTQVSPFQCDKCSASFRQKYALTLHKRKHSKNFLECERCKSQFVMQSQLRKHENQCDGTFRPYVVRNRKKTKETVQ